ncbi:hypothetical protein SODALDRAFT_324982 [Sodiomyces alkalinus F11]|uniref:Luciferase domain-containing protein n=1 Tax=Sodiomyces alkalinus (strain CBS 110278 / VKM F-3762 / F11) TaxID=1314773 RepID=A0A3N2PSF8_SODAK|nr:hypothetical protein SODALDRAFT_324982 [Sodiomyces alkalinus F11]ROT37364.1 hypothetical protein SODALDRAFT_324982 [Sodiomyces alkalinus F11]
MTVSSCTTVQLKQPESHVIPQNLGSDVDQVAATYVLKQRPISVTLDGPTIFTLTAALIFLIHFTKQSIVEIFLATVPILLLIHNDYNNFIGLGPGGTPATFQGYVRIAWLRLWAIRDPFSPPKPDPSRRPERGILHDSPLPYRPGPRPIVAGIAPQRQLDQHGTLQHYRALRRTLENLAHTRSEKFGTARSCLEKHGLGLFARHPVNVTCNGEVCHVHESDHSLHMNLHPDDIAEVLAKGWGQRHPLACKGWFGSMPVPEEFLMVYAPRDDLELQIVCRIIEAAIWFVIADREKLDVLPDTANTDGVIRAVGGNF